MSSESQSACINYLKGDVLGLQELSQNLNQRYIDEFNHFVKDSKKCPKFGIFRVEYKANKNLIDSILPRRDTF